MSYSPKIYGFRVETCLPYQSYYIRHLIVSQFILKAYRKSKDKGFSFLQIYNFLFNKNKNSYEEYLLYKLLSITAKVITRGII